MLILFCLGERNDRLAFRTAARAVMAAGEQARGVVEARAVRLNGVPSPFGIRFRRMMWWSPYRGTRVIYPPPADHGPAAARRYQQLVQEKRLCLKVFPALHLEIHMCSDDTIFYKVCIGRRWVSTYDVWMGRIGQ